MGEKVEIWRTQKMWEVQQETERLREAIMKGDKQSAALRQLIGILARLMKGAMGGWWMQCKNDWQHARRVAAVAAVEQRHAIVLDRGSKGVLQNAAVRQLR